MFVVCPHHSVPDGSLLALLIWGESDIWARHQRASPEVPLTARAAANTCRRQTGEVTGSDHTQQSVPQEEEEPGCYSWSVLSLPWTRSVAWRFQRNWCKRYAVVFFGNRQICTTCKTRWGLNIHSGSIWRNGLQSIHWTCLTACRCSVSQAAQTLHTETRNEKM